MLECVMDKLQKITRDFYEISKIQIVLYDENRKFLYAYPNQMEDFCALVRQNSSLKTECFYCDKVGFDICEHTKQPYLYRCHMHLAEALAPIIENNMLIGYLKIGQVLIDNDIEKVLERISFVCQAYHLEYSDFSAAMEHLHIISSSSIEAAVSILSMCACYLYVNQIITNKSDLLFYQLEDYISSHLNEDLSISALCNKFYISRSKLYSISKEKWDIGITDYIRNERIEAAKKMLMTTSLSVSEIAEKNGFPDANYFIRLFKKINNITPAQYRKHLKDGTISI